MFHHNKVEFLHRFLTMDETWVHHYTSAIKEQLKQWTESGKSASKKVKTVPSVGMIMASVFWNAHGIIFIDNLEEGKTINSEYYAKLLQRLRDEIREKSQHLAETKVPSR